MNDETISTPTDGKVLDFAKRFQEKPKEPRQPAEWWFDWQDSEGKRQVTTESGFVRFNPPYITVIPADLEQSAINDIVFAVSMEKLSGFGKTNTQTKAET